jgi:hypothetical protein
MLHITYDEPNGRGRDREEGNRFTKGYKKIDKK